MFKVNTYWFYQIFHYDYKSILLTRFHKFTNIIKILEYLYLSSMTLWDPLAFCGAFTMFCIKGASKRGKHLWTGDSRKNMGRHFLILHLASEKYFPFFYLQSAIAGGKISKWATMKNLQYFGKTSCLKQCVTCE